MNVHRRSVLVEGLPALPLLTLDGPRVGPCVLVTANLHGDELTGLAACHRLAQELPDRLLRGRVVLIPSLNPEGLARGTREVPSDGGDLNRLFPGRARGRGSDRLAAAIWRAITELKPVAVLDLHADAGRAIPYVLVDRPARLRGAARAHLGAELDRLAGATGLTVVHDYAEESYLRYNLDKSLTGALVNRASIPALTLEVGPRRFVDPAAVQAAVAAVCGVLGALGLLPGSERGHPTKVAGAWRREPAPRATVDGIWEPAIHPGVPVAARASLGCVRQIDGLALETLQAPRDGVVLSWIDRGWVSAGTAVGTLAVREVIG